jgi:hypothetical protein
VVLLPHPLNECGVTGWMFACLKMGACLFVAELAATALAAGWQGASGGVVKKQWRLLKA